MVDFTDEEIDKVLSAALSISQYEWKFSDRPARSGNREVTCVAQTAGGQSLLVEFTYSQPRESYSESGSSWTSAPSWDVSVSLHPMTVIHVSLSEVNDELVQQSSPTYPSALIKKLFDLVRRLSDHRSRVLGEEQHRIREADLERKRAMLDNL